MENKCNIVRDLLPSYIDHLCSKDSIHFIEEHMKSCKKCREVLESMKNDVDFTDEIDEVYKVEVKKPFQKVSRFFNGQKKLTNYLLLATLFSLLFGFIFLIHSIIKFSEHREEVTKLEVVEQEKEAIMDDVFHILGASTEVTEKEEKQLLTIFNKYNKKLNLLAIFPAADIEDWLQENASVKQKPTTIYPIEYNEAAIIIGNKGILRKNEPITPSGYDLGTVVMAKNQWVIQYEYKSPYEQTIERHHQLTYYGPSTWSIFQAPILLFTLFSVLLIFWIFLMRQNKRLKDVMG
ncbi:zf-HC2 domain-containing protein [Peribacillus simplex]|uniref:zf-HC2 domain-containing protein n=1 Tax=Peribacillus simplex TaxID=1478 RepID=UPI00203A7528|nr:zf-HC2 domain-containing protein [Peribacillus simplex]MCM3677118.1 zf-HC2 domain-containing protein [Peribacillus simplex]